MLYKRVRVYERLDQKCLGIDFLFLFKNDINSVLKIPVANFCRLITLRTHPRHSRCVASWNFNCVWYVVPTFPESKSKVLLKLCMKLLTLICRSGFQPGVRSPRVVVNHFWRDRNLILLCTQLYYTCFIRVWMVLFVYSALLQWVAAQKSWKRLVWNYWVGSQSSYPLDQTWSSKHKHLFVSEWMQQRIDLIFVLITHLN